MLQIRRSLTPAMVYYAAFYGMIGVYQGYSSLYFAAHGFSHTSVGLLQALGPVAALAAQPFWGYAADRTGRTRILRLLLALAAPAVLLYSFAGESLGKLALFVALFSLFQTSLLPLSDALTLGQLRKEGKPFGPLRAVGTLAFAASGLIAGRVFEQHPEWFPYGTALLLAAGFLATWLLPADRAAPRERPHPLRLLKDRGLLRLLAFSALLQGTLGAYFSFFPLYVQDTVGMSRAVLGKLYLVGSLTELPFLLAADRLASRWGTPKLLLGAALIMAVRWGLLALFPCAPGAWSAQLLQGGTFVVVTFAMVTAVADRVPPELRSSGQALLGAVSYGAARLTGSLVGGLLAQRLGIPAMFGIGGALCLMALLLAGKKLLQIQKGAG